MPEPLLTIGVLAGYSALYAAARGGTAVSREAWLLQESAQAVVKTAERSYALFGDKAEALAQIAILAADCQEPGWDGDEAAPVDSFAVRRAADLIRLLPDGLALPEFSAEPDGSVSLDWIVSRHRLFSVSVGRSNRLAYAWLDGTEKGHAVAVFDGARWPARLLGGIRSILNYDASLRAA